MLDTLKQSLIINFSVLLNSFIYFLKRVPVIKLFFRNTGYEHSDITMTLFIAGILFSMIKQLLTTALQLLFCFGFPLLIIKDGISGIDKSSYFWHLFFIFYLLLPLPTSSILEPHRRKFISVKLMRMNARKFVIADYFPKLLWRQVIELFLFGVTAYIFSVDIVLALFMVTAKNFFAVFTEAFKMIYYDKTGNFLHNRTGEIITYYMIVIFLGYFSAAKQYMITLQIAAIFTLGALLWFIGLLSIRYIVNYKNFSAAINDANRLDKLSIDVADIKRNATFSKVKLKKDEFTKEELLISSNNKEGFTFINEIFFRRHKRILNTPIRYQAAGVILLLITGLIGSLFIKDFHSEYVKIINHFFSILIFALYTMSTAQKATKAMFYNCDISLLHYGFYKTPNAVLATFAIRTKYLILANMIPAGLLAGGILLLNILTGGSVITLLPVAIMVIVLSIFFVVHNMFLYYIFQPYTTDLNIKNPFFKLFNFITYILCYICLQLKNVSIIFLVVVVGATLIYSVAALLTVYRIAPRTFTIK